MIGWSHSTSAAHYAESARFGSLISGSPDARMQKRCYLLRNLAAIGSSGLELSHFVLTSLTYVKNFGL